MGWTAYALIGVIALGLYAASFANPAADRVLRQRLRPLWILFVIPATGLALTVIILYAAMGLFVGPAQQMLGPIPEAVQLWLTPALLIFSLFTAIRLLARVFPRHRRWPAATAHSGRALPLVVRFMKLFGAYTAFLLVLLLVGLNSGGSETAGPSVAANAEPAAGATRKLLLSIFLVLPHLALSLAVARARPTPLSYVLGFVFLSLLLINFPFGTALGAALIAAWRRPVVWDYFYAPPVLARRPVASPGG